MRQVVALAKLGTRVVLFTAFVLLVFACSVWMIDASQRNKDAQYSASSWGGTPVYILKADRTGTQKELQGTSQNTVAAKQSPPETQTGSMVLIFPGFWRTCEDLWPMALHLSKTHQVVCPDIPAGPQQAKAIGVLLSWMKEDKNEKTWAQINGSVIERMAFITHSASSQGVAIALAGAGDFSVLTRAKAEDLTRIEKEVQAAFEIYKERSTAGQGEEGQRVASANLADAALAPSGESGIFIKDQATTDQANAPKDSATRATDAAWSPLSPLSIILMDPVPYDEQVFKSALMALRSSGTHIALWLTQSGSCNAKRSETLTQWYQNQLEANTLLDPKAGHLDIEGEATGIVGTLACGKTSIEGAQKAWGFVDQALAEQEEKRLHHRTKQHDVLLQKMVFTHQEALKAQREEELLKLEQESKTGKNKK